MITVLLLAGCGPMMARNVPGKPGFVTSPYPFFHSPLGYIDVRGFPPGTRIKDPYSGRIIIVPPAPRTGN